MTDRKPPVRIVRSQKYGNIAVQAERRTCDCGREFWAWPDEYTLQTDHGPVRRKLTVKGDQYRCSHCLMAEAQQGKQLGDTYRPAPGTGSK